MTLRGWLYRRLVLGAGANRDLDHRRQIAAFDPSNPNPWLRETLARAREGVPYYRDLLAPIADPVADFCSVPFLTRDLVRANYRRLMSESRDPAACVEATTGGSTGKPLTVMHDRDHKEWIRAAEGYYWREFLGVVPEEIPMVVFWASAHAIWGQRRSTAKRLTLWLTQTDLLGSSRITPAEFEEGIAAINRRRPVAIKAYASPLYQIARHVRQNNLRIHKPRLVFSLAETLHPQMRALIEEVFACPVFDFYASREVGPIAGQCRRGRMHLFPFTTHAEVLDPQNRPAAPGTEGRVVVTSLHNAAMPLIRYEIGDAAVAGRPCDCGSRLPTLERVAGRLLDYFTARDGTIVHGGYFTLLLYRLPWVDEFRVVQRAMDEVEVHFVARGAVSAADKAGVESRIRLVMGPTCAVSWHEAQTLPPTAHGKRLYTISHVGTAWAGGPHPGQE